MEIYLDPEEQVQCPYNNSHYIRRKRMNTHLTKCKMSNPDAPLVECDFNVIHKIPEPELQWHHENCPDRKKIEIAIYQEEKTDLNKFPILNLHVPTEESWDNDNAPSYNPEKYCETKEIIRHKDVIPRAQRRNFKMEERERVRAVMENKKRFESRSEPTSSKYESFLNQPVTSLPETSSKHVNVNEATPDFIADIVQRIRIGANESYIQKRKP